MARVEIKKKDGAKGSLTGENYEFLIDGNDITKLLPRVASIELRFKPARPNECVITLHVDDVKIDADVDTKLQGRCK
jgi:hypothetical protein